MNQHELANLPEDTLVFRIERVSEIPVTAWSTDLQALLRLRDKLPHVPGSYLKIMDIEGRRVTAAEIFPQERGELRDIEYQLDDEPYFNSLPVIDVDADDGEQDINNLPLHDLTEKDLEDMK